MIRLARQEPVRITRKPTLELIPIFSIRPNPYQPRKYFSDEATADLADSIRQIGLLQPINVRRAGEGGYELIAGERRLRACKLAGLTEIKAIVLDSAYDRDIAMIAMIENLQRENLHFFEEAEGYQNLIREHGFTQEELATRLAKNQSTVANKLRILKLPRPVKEKIIAGGLTERHARALLRLHNEEAQLRLLEHVCERGLSVKATEELVEKELLQLYGEEKENNLIRMRCNYKIYVNTLRKCADKIAAMGVNTDFHFEDQGDFIQVVVKIAK